MKERPYLEERASYVWKGRATLVVIFSFGKRHMPLSLYPLRQGIVTLYMSEKRSTRYFENNRSEDERVGDYCKATVCDFTYGANKNGVKG